MTTASTPEGFEVTPEAPPFSAAQLIAAEQVQRHRAKYDAWAAVPHRRDHRGGPVAVWE